VDSPGLDLDQNFVLAVHGMKMRHAMLAIEHPDHNTQESGELRHLASSSWSIQSA
jgi:hypothetical protein